MHIAFWVGSTGISGGTYVILEYACRLQQAGFQVSAITEEPVDSSDLSWHPGAEELEWIPLERAREDRFDYLLATWWQSLYLLHEVKAGAYIYFVQSIESRFFPQENQRALDTRDIHVLRDWCERTYALPIPVITEAKWIKEYLESRYNNQDVHLVHNGIRKDLYCPSGPVIASREKGKLRVLIEGPVGVFFKNVEKTIELCIKAEVDEIWLLTSTNLSSYPGVDRCFSCVPITETPAIYRSCDVLVKLSYVEGMFGPPLEMFHCGGTAVVYDVSGHDEYMVDEVNSYVLHRDDEAGVVARLRQLKENPILLDELKEEALKTAERWPDWARSAARFQEILKQIPTDSRTHQSFLRNFTEQARVERDRAFQACSTHRFMVRESSAGEPEEDKVNFIQVYFHGGEGFTNEKMVWTLYLPGAWTQCQVAVPIEDGEQIQLRVDPSVRIGLVAIREIGVYLKTGGLIQKWVGEELVRDLFVTGTAKIIRSGEELVLLCFAEDPQIVLPILDFQKTGGEVIVVIQLKETAVGEGLVQDVEQLSGSLRPGMLYRFFDKGKSLFRNYFYTRQRS